MPRNSKEIEFLKLLNKISNIYVVNKAVGNYEGIATLYLTDCTDNSRLFPYEDSNNKTIQTDITTLDNLIQKGLEPPDFIKIDTVGSELEVLEGFLRSVNEYHPAFIIMLYKPSNDAKIGRFFKEHGYSIFRLNNDFARKFAKQRRPIVEIKHPETGWPAPEGTWGHILVLHLDRHSEIIDSLRSSKAFA
ncbi:FkbM family methyltransferase [bacterium]|nr:MAG: FkbM family methyltransferase [bacterium]